MRTYLSIDLDFWNVWKEGDDFALAHMDKFLRMAKRASKGNIQLVDSHESLTKFVGKACSEHLINVDYHTDIWDRFNPRNPIAERQDYNCGTWVNFVKKESRLLYTWIHPHQSEEERFGYCSHYESPFEDKGVKLTGWKMAEKIASKNPEKHIQWNNVVAVGVSFGYYWVETRNGWQDRVFSRAAEIFGRKPNMNKKARV